MNRWMCCAALTIAFAAFAEGCMEEPTKPCTGADCVSDAEITANIKAEIFTTQFGQAEGLKVRANWDPMINKALDYLPQAKALESAAKHAETQRASVRANQP